MAKRNTYFQDEVIERKIDIKQFGKVLRYILPYKKIFLFVCFLMAFSSIVSMITPLSVSYTHLTLPTNSLV